MVPHPQKYSHASLSRPLQVFGASSGLSFVRFKCSIYLDLPRKLTIGLAGDVFNCLVDYR